MSFRKNRKGTVLLLIASIGFLIASVWLMQSEIKPKNIGSIEFAVLELGNSGQNNLYYIDVSAEYSLINALEIKSRNYQSQQKTYTNKEVCNLQLDACQKGATDCKTNLKLFCEDEIEKAFRERFSKYLENLNKETKNELSIKDYQLEIKTITSEMTTKVREIEVVGKTEKTIKTKEGNIEYSIKPNFRVRVKL